jgi:hypothetical protein
MPGNNSHSFPLPPVLTRLLVLGYFLLNRNSSRASKPCLWAVHHRQSPSP